MVARVYVGFLSCKPCLGLCCLERKKLAISPGSAIKYHQFTAFVIHSYRYHLAFWWNQQLSGWSFSSVFWVSPIFLMFAALKCVVNPGSSLWQVPSLRWSADRHVVEIQVGRLLWTILSLRMVQSLGSVLFCFSSKWTANDVLFHMDSKQFMFWKWKDSLFLVTTKLHGSFSTVALLLHSGFSIVAPP